MRTKVLLSVCALVLVVGGYGLAQTPWKEFSSKDGRFSIQMPGTPSESKQTLNFDTLHLFMLEVGQGVPYAVTYNDLRGPLLGEADKTKLLDLTRDKEAQKGKLRSEKRVSLDGHAGRELILDTQGLTLRYRMFVVKNRLYQVVAITPKGQESSEDVEKFLNSFKVTE